MAAPLLVLLHGAWHGPWCWARLVPELERRGATVLTPDLRLHDPVTRYSDCVASVEEALLGTTVPDEGPVLVAHSFGGLIAPVVAARRRVRRLIFIDALLPVPGHSLTDQLRADPEILCEDLRRGARSNGDGTSSWSPDAAMGLFYDDCSPADARWAAERLRPHAGTVAAEPCRLDEWPDVPLDSLVSRGDLCVSPTWSRRAARERLGVEALEMDGGHSPFLARPAELADILLARTLASG